MKNLILGVLLLLTTQTNFGQVETKFFPNKDALSKIEKIKQHPKAQKTMKIPSFNKEALLEEDNKNNGKDVPFRFGKGFDVNVNLSDGMWAEVDSEEDYGQWNLNQAEPIQLILFLTIR